MDFCTIYFGKPLAAVSFDDVANYFHQPRIENANIEFKSYAKGHSFEESFKKVVRGVSSFLNSEGGILIWGAPQGKKSLQTKEDVFEGELCPVLELRTKDQLVNRFSTDITPIATGINIHIVGEPGKYVYLFEVQESNIKPHQYDYRYYIRLDGQSRPAPHYVVDALMKRISYPNLSGVIKFHDIQWDLQIPHHFHLPMTIAMFNFSELQNEESVSFRLLCIGGYFPAGRTFLKVKTNPSYLYNGGELVYENIAKVLHFGTPVSFDSEVVFSPKTLNETEGRFELVLSFGGKRSPAKMSHYSFRVTFLPNFACELILCNENVLYAENSKAMNKTMQDSLQAFTGR